MSETTFDPKAIHASSTVGAAPGCHLLVEVFPTDDETPHTYAVISETINDDGERAAFYVGDHDMLDTFIGMLDGAVNAMREPARAAAVEAGTTRWSALFPEGRTIFYEGDDIEGCTAWLAERGIVMEHGLDPSNGFHCRAEHLDEVYTSLAWPMGS